MQARTFGRVQSALEAASSDQPPPDCIPPPPQLSGLDALDTAPQLSAAMELLVDHEGPREDTEAAPGEGMHFFPPRSTADILRNSEELLGLFMSYRLSFNESEFERKRLSSLVLADFHSVGGGKRRAYAELIKCACVRERLCV